MNTPSSKRIRPACLYGLLALSVWILASPGSANADNTNPASAQTRPDSPAQVKPGANTAPRPSTFTPAPAGTTPAETATGGTNAKQEK